MRKVLSEPLLHFLLLGAVLFAVYAWRGPREGHETIVVSAGHVEHLSTTFARTWQRSPTNEELQALIDGYVVDEMLSREAIKLGLDRDDTVIRRRLRQKMEFVTEDLAALQPPTEADLERYLAEHPDAFRASARYQFQQVFIGADGDDVSARAAALIAQLEAGARPESLGDPLAVPAVFSDVSAREVDRTFGDGFAARLDGVAPGAWAGPVRSGYGAHVIRVTMRTEARQPELAEVRAEVERELLTARRMEAQQRVLESLRERYDVVIEPDAAAPAGSSGQGSH